MSHAAPPPVHDFPPASDEACYLALKARDARFDGIFFTGITSTGIYCRPVCRVKTPRQENCRFFALAAQAERAGFRPCLRCRPELAPLGGCGPSAAHAAWSSQDASAILAQQAARWMDEPEAWGDEAPTVRALARRLGVSDRHMRRIFEDQFGVSPLQYLQTRRLLTAKQLLTDTDLSVMGVAMASGFASLRRFNAAFAAHYGLSPTRLRRQDRDGRFPPEHSTVVRLGYRPPYDVNALLGFFRQRRITGIETIADAQDEPVVRRTLRMAVHGREHKGWLAGHFDGERCVVKLRVSDSLREVLPQVIRRLRAALDLDADPAAIGEVLHGPFPRGDGLRVPGAMDGYELAVRAVLGQQITVAAARTLTQRLVDHFGEPLRTPWPDLNRLFPAAGVLARAEGDTLGSLGIVRQRQAAIVALARAVDQGGLPLHPGVDVPATITRLKALPGIGDWTAQYIAMRALRWPDAFPAGDVALQKALGVGRDRHPARAAEAASQAWRPWRSYAVIRAWQQADSHAEIV